MKLGNKCEPPLQSSRSVYTGPLRNNLIAYVLIFQESIAVPWDNQVKSCTLNIPLRNAWSLWIIWCFCTCKDGTRVLNLAGQNPKYHKVVHHRFHILERRSQKFAKWLDIFRWLAPVEMDYQVYLNLASHIRSVLSNWRDMCNQTSQF